MKSALPQAQVIYGVSSEVLVRVVSPDSNEAGINGCALASATMFQ
jgi:hypothetical protein